MRGFRDNYRLFSICSVTWFLLALLEAAESDMCTVTKMAMVVPSGCNWCNQPPELNCNCVYFSEPSIKCCLSDNAVTCCPQEHQSQPDPISCNINPTRTVPITVSYDYHYTCDWFCDCCVSTSQEFSCSYMYSLPCSSSTTRISSYVGTLSVSQIEPHITSVSTFISTMPTVIASNTPSAIISNDASVPSSINPSVSIVIPESNNASSSASSIVLPVVAGVLPAVCLLVLCAIGAIATLCIILSQRKAKHQIPVNQQPGTTDSLLRMDNVYYAVTQTTQQPQGDGHRGDTTELPDVQHPTTYSTLASTQAEDDGEALPDYSMITLENMSPGTQHTVPAVGAVYSTVVRMDGKKTTVTLGTNSSSRAATSSNDGDITCDDPDYFDDPSLLQQIRANKQ